MKNNTRIDYEMTQKQLDKLYEACKPVPMIVLQTGEVRPRQERINNSWDELGREMGFDGQTAKPINGKSYLHFSAEATNNEK